MIALMPPKHDLRGGHASAAFVAMSNSILIVSMNCCVFAAGSDEIAIAVITMSRTRAERDLYSTGRRGHSLESSGDAEPR